MIDISPETHRRIIREINQDIKDSHGINLSIKKLGWGAVSPDILPEYRLICHYKEGSIDYIAKEIITIIHFFQFTDLTRLNSLQNKISSTKLGAVGHHLSDRVCLPHVKKWRCNQHSKDHTNYERVLDKISQNHVFNKRTMKTSRVDIDNDGYMMLKILVRNYIEDIVDKYSMSEDRTRDLNFAYGLGYSIFCSIFETIEIFSTERYYQKSFVLQI